MRPVFEDIASDDGIDIIIPEQRTAGSQCLAVCLCCERTDQPMDDDGCGICDACLGLPARASDNPDGLELPSALPIYRSLPVVDDCLQRWCSVARS